MFKQLADWLETPLRNRLVQKIQMNIDRIRQLRRGCKFRFDDPAPLNQAWHHAVEAGSAFESYLFWLSRAYGTMIYPACLESAKRNLALSWHLMTGYPTAEGQRLFSLKEEAERRRERYRKVLPPDRELTRDEIMLGPVMGICSPPRSYQVCGELNSLARDCNYEAMIALADREHARLTNID